MTTRHFADLVHQAIEEIPEFFRRRFENIGIDIMPYAPPDVARSLGRHPAQLLGVYQGIPYHRRGPWYGNVMHDRILIFQAPIERMCRSDDEVRHLVRRVVIHEVGHYFGLSDPELRKLEAEADRAAAEKTEEETGR